MKYESEKEMAAQREMKQVFEARQIAHAQKLIFIPIDPTGIAAEAAEAMDQAQHLVGTPRRSKEILAEIGDLAEVRIQGGAMVSDAYAGVTEDMPQLIAELGRAVIGEETMKRSRRYWRSRG